MNILTPSIELSLSLFEIYCGEVMYIYTATHDYVQFKYNNCHSSSGGEHVRSFAWSWTYGLIWLNKYSFLSAERPPAKENKRNIHFSYVEIKDIKFVSKRLLVCVPFSKIGGRFAAEKIASSFRRMLIAFSGSVYFSFTNTTPGCIADSLKWWYFRIPESGEKSVDRNVFQSYQQNPSFTTMALFPLADFWTTFARSWSESLSALQHIYQVFIYKSYTYSSLHDSIHFERMNGHVRK